MDSPGITNEDLVSNKSIPNVTKLFLGGISWNTSEEALKEYFSKYGEVEDVMVMREKVSKKPRGFGFITFKTKAAADSACVYSHNIDGRQVDAKPSIPRREKVQRTRRYFVGGLSPDTTEQTFYEYFERFGEVTDATIMVDHNNGRSRGFGFITLSDETTSVLLDGEYSHEIDGKRVEIKNATPRGTSASVLPPGSYPPPPSATTGQGFIVPIVPLPFPASATLGGGGGGDRGVGDRNSGTMGAGSLPFLIRGGGGGGMYPAPHLSSVPPLYAPRLGFPGPGFGSMVPGGFSNTNVPLPPMYGGYHGVSTGGPHGPFPVSLPMMYGNPNPFHVNGYGVSPSMAMGMADGLEGDGYGLMVNSGYHDGLGGGGGGGGLYGPMHSSLIPSDPLASFNSPSSGFMPPDLSRRGSGGLGLYASANVEVGGEETSMRSIDRFEGGGIGNGSGGADSSVKGYHYSNTVSVW